MSEINVACVLRSGGNYTADWVRRLRDGITRHLTLPHRFVALSDVDVPCERLPLKHGWRGWWSKLELFYLTGPVLYFDLDTVVVGSLNAMASHPHRFTMAHDFYRPKQMSSTAMAWNGDYSFIADAYAQNPRSIARHYDGLLGKEKRIGDQAFIEDQLAAHGVKPDTFRDLFGERSVASYKVHDCRAQPPKDAAVVAFHGRPKPSDIRSGWVAENWR